LGRFAVEYVLHLRRYPFFRFRVARYRWIIAPLNALVFTRALLSGAYVITWRVSFIAANPRARSLRSFSLARLRCDFQKNDEALTNLNFIYEFFRFHPKRHGIQSDLKIRLANRS
jgi:hypothetical protein